MKGRTKMIYESRTHQGCVRTSNQDTLLVYPERDLFGVADGMGGHKAGDMASSMAVEIVTRSLKDANPSRDLFRLAVEFANKEIYHKQQNDTNLSGMGTTFTALWKNGDSFLIAHVGDSRAYLLRDGELRQITSDHSLVAEMIHNGTITKEEARTNPYRNIITRAVGTDFSVAVDMLEMDIQKGDKWLVCSDGLNEHVDDEQIRRILNENTLKDAADLLLSTTLENGGSDNVSIVLAEVDA
ncbi:MAG: serine/threonine-protein phosphatase [Clostridiales bacterium]|nr:serine/threonine-protein phosphatase [Clostridiales bacterium]